MKFGSLFAGIGGFDLGLERAGWECAWQVENDPYCNRVLAKHWPDVRRYGDVREVGAHNLAPTDLICGGFPCQPFSVAGKQRGKEDDRHLWPEYFRIIKELRPTWVLGENVFGIVRLGLDEVLSDLESADYQTQTFVIPACAVDAPHRRDRVWIVGHSERDGLNDPEAGSRTKSRNERSKEGKDKLCEPQGTSSLREKNVADSNGIGFRDTLERQKEIRQPCGRDKQDEDDGTGAYWLPEPELGRVAHGIPNRVDRLRCLGNAVVPQLVEVIGRAMLDCHKRNG